MDDPQIHTEIEKLVAEEHYAKRVTIRALPTSGAPKGRAL